MKRCAILGLIVFAVTAAESCNPLWAQNIGNAREGAMLARQVCAECHGVLANDTKSPNPMAPTFVSAAAAPGMTERALRVWLQSPHPTMPNLVLTNDQKDNVIAYIIGLKRK